MKRARRSSRRARLLGGTYRQDFGAFIERVAAAGTPEQVARRLQEFVDAGARRIIIVPCSDRGPGRQVTKTPNPGEIVPLLELPWAGHPVARRPQAILD